jgi:hypothetical protein
MLRKKLVSAILVATGATFDAAWAEEKQRNVTELETVSVEERREETLKPVHISTSTTLHPEASEMERGSTASLGEALDGLPGVNNLSSGSQSGKPIRAR